MLFSVSQIVHYEHLLFKMGGWGGVGSKGQGQYILKEKPSIPRLFCLANATNQNSTLPFTTGLNFPLTFEQFNSFIIAAG